MTNTTVKTKNQKVNEYILSCISADGYNSSHPDTMQGKLSFLYENFKDEYGHEIQRRGEQNAMADWFSGLPSSFNIDFNYCDIISRAKEFGSIPENATGKALEIIEDKVCANWFNWMAAKTLMLIRKHK